MVIRVTGPESSGKTTLARALAWCLDGAYVAEQARPYLHQRGGSYTEQDLRYIWQQQVREEFRARQSGASYVICDTGPEVIYIWGQVKYGRSAAPVRHDLQQRSYDLTLLCAPDLPWVPDPLREAPDLTQRQELFVRYQTLLPEAVVIRGQDRIGQALRRSLPA